MKVLWNCGPLQSTELAEVEDGQLAGTVLLPIDGAPGRIDYAVVMGDDGHTGSVVVAIDDGRRFVLARNPDGHRWTVDGERRPELDGCPDADLGFSPSTNTLALRALGLAVGERAEVVGAWLRWPELVVEPLPQSYQRIAEDRYAYAAPSLQFETVLEVDGDIVIRYGDELWQAVSVS